MKDTLQTIGVGMAILPFLLVVLLVSLAVAGLGRVG